VSTQELSFQLPLTQISVLQQWSYDHRDTIKQEFLRSISGILNERAAIPRYLRTSVQICHFASTRNSVTIASRESCDPIPLLYDLLDLILMRGPLGIVHFCPMFVLDNCSSRPPTPSIIPHVSALGSTSPQLGSDIKSLCSARVKRDLYRSRDAMMFSVSVLLKGNFSAFPNFFRQLSEGLKRFSRSFKVVSVSLGAR